VLSSLVPHSKVCFVRFGRVLLQRATVSGNSASPLYNSLKLEVVIFSRGVLYILLRRTKFDHRFTTILCRHSHSQSISCSPRLIQGLSPASKLLGRALVWRRLAFHCCLACCQPDISPARDDESTVSRRAAVLVTVHVSMMPVYSTSNQRLARVNAGPL
jgi:hypothetical protein